MVGEHPLEQEVRAHIRRSTALPAQGRATRQSEQRERVRMKRKRQKIKSAVGFKAAALRTIRSRRRAPCAISSVITARRRLQLAASAGEKIFPPSGTRM